MNRDSSAEQPMKNQRCNSTDDSTDNRADQDISPISGGKGFRFHPLAFLAGFIIGSALYLILARLPRTDALLGVNAEGQAGLIPPK